MPTLFILCGIPASGKTTWADEFEKLHSDVRYVSRDEIRLFMLKENEPYFAHEKEVFKKFSDTIAQTLVDGFDCIADATHLNYKSRFKLTNAIDKYITNYEIAYVVFETDIVSCLLRNRRRTGRKCVPDKEMCSMYANWEPPTIHEDYLERKARLIICNGDIFNQ